MQKRGVALIVAKCQKIASKRDSCGALLLLPPICFNYLFTTGLLYMIQSLFLHYSVFRAFAVNGPLWIVWAILWILLSNYSVQLFSFDIFQKNPYFRKIFPPSLRNIKPGTSPDFFTRRRPPKIFTPFPAPFFYNKNIFRSFSDSTLKFIAKKIATGKTSLFFEFFSICLFYFNIYHTICTSLMSLDKV